MHRRVHDGLISESFTHLTEDMCQFNLLKNKDEEKNILKVLKVAIPILGI